MGSFLSYILHRMVEYPVKRRPVCFYGADDFDPTGQPYSEFKEDEVAYDRTVREMFSGVLEWRKKLYDARQKQFECKPAELAKRFPGWDEIVIQDLLNTITAIDVTGDGVIDFQKMCTFLDDIGDHTPEKQRHAEFDVIDKEKNGYIDFEQFVEFMYAVTMKDMKPGNLGQAFRVIDRNVKAINSMSCFQQMQAGLF